jgi:diacylglycerol O-acyltransferase / wax synthase
MARGTQMTPVDTAWLRMDRPNNLMMIVSLLILDGPVDSNRLIRLLDHRLTAIPRFRQRVEKNSHGYAWVDDAHFSINAHIRRTRLPAPGGSAELARFVSELATQPLSRARALWQLHIVEYYDGGAALVVRIHHAIADGIALVGIMLSLTDSTPDADLAGIAATPNLPRTIEKEAEPEDHSIFGPVAGAIAHGFKVSASMWATYVDYSSSVWNAYLEMIAHPAKALEYAQMGTGITAELAHLLLMSEDSRTRFKGSLSGEKRLAWTDPLALADVKTVSHACASSINDLMLATVAGALRGYLEEKGDPTEGIELRATIPVNLRPPGSERDLGNWFGLVAVELPVGVADPMARLREVGRRMAALKKSYEPRVTLGLISALGSAPKVLQDKLFDLLLSRMTAVITNVPGPQKPLYMAGSRWRQAMFWVPQSANIGLGVSILSFDGHLQFGVITDAALVPDPQAIVDRFRSEFETYARLTGITVSASATAPVEPSPGAARALKPGNPGGKAPRPAARSPSSVRVKAVGTKRSPKVAPIS